jgi:hypothetical protein
MKYSIIFMMVFFTSCDWAKKKTKDTVNKTGEIIAKTGSEFVDGVSKGIEKTFNNEIELGENLKNRGIQLGKIKINSSDSTSDNILNVYVIFGNDFDQNILVKVMNEDGQEYGRSNQMVVGKKGDAKYIDFIFDKRTNIDGKGKLIFN